MHDEPPILHADADAFFASVEQRDDPALRGRPTLVGGGVVMAASYEARARGVRGGMGGRRARLLCPDAVVVRPRFSAYVEASRELFRVFEELAPSVEGLSMEEAFLDVRGLEEISGTPVEIARTLRRRARETVGLAVTVGVARTKVLAKMASRAAKPDGLLVVRAKEETEFLHPLPVEALWGVGPKTAERLRGRGVRFVGDIARLDVTVLAGIVGRHAARHLHAISRNVDRRKVRAGRGRRSFGSQSALGRSRRSRAEVDAVLVALADRVSRRMRASRRAGRTVTLRLRFGDYTRATRSRTLPHPTAGTGSILAAARALLENAEEMVRQRGITLVGIAVTNLAGQGCGAQLELPLEGRADQAALDAALDEVRERFGPDAIRRAATSARDPSLTPWLRPGEEPELETVARRLQSGGRSAGRGGDEDALAGGAP
ncbi:MAG TPA: DNA polymerase IV [Solirubrobacterales bacterium]|nr:DNA polymerase IV [Solirubrobacterales bacterium]